MTKSRTQKSLQKPIGKPPSKPASQNATTKKQTKKAHLIALLSRKSETDVPSLSKTLNWLPHTTRAALSGLRKAGYEIKSVKPSNGKPLRYRIVAVPGKDAA